MTLGFEFESSAAMWYALRNYFWEPKWNPETKTNIPLGLTSTNRTVKVRCVYDLPATIQIEVEKKPEPGAYIRLDGLRQWQLLPANVVEISAKGAAA